MIYIGIDPDTTKSGVAIIDTKAKSIILAYYTISEVAYHLTDTIKALYDKSEYKIFLESVGHTKRNFHFKGRTRQNKANAMGFDIGRCAQVQTTIKELFDYHKIDCEVVMPLVKCWKGPDRKITHEEIKQIVENAGYKLPSNRTSQEQRDALLLAWNYANLPIKISYGK